MGSWCALFVLWKNYCALCSVCYSAGIWEEQLAEAVQGAGIALTVGAAIRSKTFRRIPISIRNISFG